LRTVHVSNSRIFAALSSLIVLISLLRIIATYSDTAQTFDEPCHVSAGIEFLDKGTYTLDPVHPPLARIAIALPLYLAGERYPGLSPTDPASHNYNVVGNHILYDSGHLMRNLALARMGVLPFFILGAVIVYLWTKHAGDDLSALIAVFLYCTIPSILAFSSIAYTDMVAASTQLAAMYVFFLWLEKADRTRTIWLGLALGAAFLAKLTSVLFIPAAALCMAVVWFLRHRREPSPRLSSYCGKLLPALALAAVVVWGGYRFSLHHLREATGITASSVPSFQHFPNPLRLAARNLILRDPLLPAPELLNGVAQAWVLNKSEPQSYLLGQMRSGGWWYFYLVALGVKLPLPLLLLFGISVVIFIKEKNKDKREPRIFLPLAALAAVLLVTMHVSYQVGLRHILVALPLIAIIAGLGAGRLIRDVSLRSVATAAVAVLLLWQAVESGAAQSDFLAYFNPIAGKDPSRVLVMGCDLDCGQDLYRLAQELRSRHISSYTLAIWSSADIDRSGLPPYKMPGSDDRSEGWIALSSRALRLGDILHQSFPPDHFAWLERYAPAAYIGKTIRLYYIPNEVAPKTANSD
jgi:4-amino-4-deoxy-L-arabinose transferase-like glycosyltransferase